MKLHELKPFAAGLMAAAMMFSSCGSDDEGTPDPGPGPEPEEIFLPELTVSLVDGFQSIEMNSTADHLYLHADSVQLVLSWEKEADKKYATMGDLSLKMGDETYALTATDNGFETAVLRDDFNDAYLTDFDLLAEAPVEDEEYEGDEEKVSLDFTLTTGKFGSVVFDFQTDYRYSTVQICDAAGGNCQVWMAENLRWESDEIGGGRDYIQPEETEKIPNYVRDFGHLYTFSERDKIIQDLENSNWTVPTGEEWYSLCDLVGGELGEGDYSDRYFGVFEVLNDPNFWNDPEYDKADYNKENWTNSTGLGLRAGGRFMDFFGSEGVWNLQRSARFHVVPMGNNNRHIRVDEGFVFLAIINGEDDMLSIRLFKK
ncbi:FISUMP domain-containing protein [Persicobacter diffluens]|uniref:Fibrobacter succinogenes major paralogous domain-containing protein n=1 Tax=Persicobacter diffluens TaxID=981 RepID=A0AAN4W1N2_9BACT|nr:hypothetical protein PEDI_39790 [Persicobacter diffluens]